MIEDLIKKLTAATEANTEATIINNDLLRDHIKIREACAEDPIAEVPDSVKTEAPEVDEAAERKAKAAKKRAAKKKAEADAQEAIDKLAAKEQDEPAEEKPVKADDSEVTGDDIRAYVRGVRAEMEPAEKAEHKKGFKALLQDGDYKTINDIPAEDLAEFLDDTKGLIG